jgi:hypothetical protein
MAAIPTRLEPCVRAIQMHSTPAPLFIRIRGEYREMPGLRLTLTEAARLWQIEPAACEAVLGALVDEGFLTRTRDGAFISTTEGNSRST